MATKYTKTLVLKASDGDVTLTGGKAQALQNKLDNDARFFHFTDGDDAHIEKYYNVASAACGACLFATVTSGSTTTADKECEEALMACAPIISSITPEVLDPHGGEKVVIVAENIDSTAVVLFDGSVIEANVSGNQIDFSSPEHDAGEVEVSIIASGKQSEKVTVTYK